jgi:hypothetical protein
MFVRCADGPNVVSLHTNDFGAGIDRKQLWFGGVLGILLAVAAGIRRDKRADLHNGAAFVRKRIRNHHTGSGLLSKTGKKRSIRRSAGRSPF